MFNIFRKKKILKNQVLNAQGETVDTLYNSNSFYNDRDVIHFKIHLADGGVIIEHNELDAKNSVNTSFDPKRVLKIVPADELDTLPEVLSSILSIELLKK
jgi:hypothetical protein